MEKRLYFHCDEKFVLDHRCKFYKLGVMIVDEKEIEGKIEEVTDKKLSIKASEEEANLNSSSMVGLDSSKTMKLIRRI